MSSSYGYSGALAALLACAAVVAPAAQAETLTDALIKAYQMSPVLETARAQLRATDEGVAAARSARRPSVQASGSATATIDRDNDFDFVPDTYRASLDAQLTLYDHGRTQAAIQAARSLVSAGRADLRNVEQTVLLNAVSAYVTVRRDMEFVFVAESNVRILEQQVQAALDRFDVGEVTRTDVSLSRARLAQAQANLSLRRGQLEASKSLYRQVVGVAPSNLQPPPALPALPRSLAEAEALAVREHPRILAARFAEIAAGFDVDRAKAAYGPNVALTGQTAFTSNESVLAGRNRNTTISVGVEGSVPLYRGGALSSAVRQAEAILERRKAELQDAARTIRQAVADAYSDLAVARAQIQANVRQVEAARIAFEGVREEAQLGARTTLDVLDLEQELRDAQVQLASARRDEYVAAYSVLAATGLLSVEHLGLGIPTYDPDVNYQRVQHGPYSAKKSSILDKLRDRYAR